MVVFSILLTALLIQKQYKDLADSAVTAPTTDSDFMLACKRHQYLSI